MYDETKDHADIWIGGCLALSGTALALAGSLAKEWLDRRFQRRKLLRERYEELTSCMAELNPWIGRLYSARDLDGVKENRPPLGHRRMLILALIYFPELKAPVMEYYNALIDRYHLACKCAIGDSPMTVGGRVIREMARLGQRDELDVLLSGLYAMIEKHAAKYANA